MHTQTQNHKCIIQFSLFLCSKITFKRGELKHVKQWAKCVNCKFSLCMRTLYSLDSCSCCMSKLNAFMWCPLLFRQTSEGLSQRLVIMKVNPGMGKWTQQTFFFFFQLDWCLARVKLTSSHLTHGVGCRCLKLYCKTEQACVTLCTGSPTQSTCRWLPDNCWVSRDCQHLGKLWSSTACIRSLTLCAQMCGVRVTIWTSADISTSKRWALHSLACEDGKIGILQLFACVNKFENQPCHRNNNNANFYSALPIWKFICPSCVQSSARQ